MDTPNASLSQQYFRVQINFQSCFRGLSPEFALYSEPPHLAWQSERSTGRCSSLCTPWEKQALGAAEGRDSPQHPAKSFLGAGPWHPVLGLAKKEPVARKSQVLCWHHLSKKGNSSIGHSAHDLH